jgi:hypothetical protein
LNETKLRDGKQNQPAKGMIQITLLNLKREGQSLEIQPMGDTAASMLSDSSLIK